jgi:hypothetical protein
MDDDRDDLILEGRLAGRSVPAIAKQYRCASSEVEAVIDRRLNFALDNDMRLKAIKLDVARLEGLMAPFYERATKDRDVAAGTLCVKILERRALLLGLDSPVRIDVTQVELQQAPTRYEKIKQALFALKYPDSCNGDAGAALSPPDGNAGPAARDGDKAQ